MLDNWQRIEQVIKWAGTASVSAFARDIGLNRGENLYQIKRGNNGISKDLAESIAAKYPEISKAWLLTGEGDMLYNSAARQRFDIPFYRTDAVELAASDRRAEPEYYVSFPMFGDCDFAAFSFSDCMSPEIARGSTLFFQQVEPSSLTPGGIYLVVSPAFRGIRTVRKERGSDRVRLVPRNLKEYDEIEIAQRDIEKLYLVRGIIINKSV